MQAFISYSHNDNQMLEMLHKHLAQLQRDNIITTWTDSEIPVGGNLDKNISAALSQSELFIALLSPDYIASNYCYEQEFKNAIKMHEKGDIIIIPVVVEPCDWLSTPFKKFKAIPKDGKAVSTWQNINTAFLDVIQNIRKLIDTSKGEGQKASKEKESPITFTRNYRVQKDFDSIEKLEHLERTFHEIKECIKRYIDEVIQLENIKARTLIDNDNVFQCMLINRNKIASEAQLKISITTPTMRSRGFDTGAMEINYSIKEENRHNKIFSLTFDEFHLFYIENNYFSTQRGKVELTAKDMADIIWKEWLESVGIL